jgi:hypothetical protein
MAADSVPNLNIEPRSNFSPTSTMEFVSRSRRFGCLKVPHACVRSSRSAIPLYVPLAPMPSLSNVMKDTNRNSGVIRPALMPLPSVRRIAMMPQGYPVEQRERPVNMAFDYMHAY